jgi:hypothetical protein
MALQYVTRVSPPDANRPRYDAAQNADAASSAGLA